MTTNLRLKNPTCRAYIFKRLLSYVLNQINNFIIFLIETVGQKNKNPRLRDLAAKKSRIRDPKKHKKTRFRDSFKTPSRFRDWNKNFRDPEFSGYHLPPLFLKVAQNSFPLFPRRIFWCAIITSLYQLMLQSWYQKTAQSLLNTLVLFSWHYRLP